MKARKHTPDTRPQHRPQGDPCQRQGCGVAAAKHHVRAATAPKEPRAAKPPKPARVARVLSDVETLLAFAEVCQREAQRSFDVRDTHSSDRDLTRYNQHHGRGEGWLDAARVALRMAWDPGFSGALASATAPR